MLGTGLCSITFRSLGISEVVELASRAGLAAIEWGGDLHVPPGDASAAHEARSLCERAGIQIPSYGSYLRAGVEDGIAPVIETARALGALTVRVWAGATSSASAGPRERERVADSLREYAQAAQGAGISISTEFHPGTLCDTAEATSALLAEVDHPALFTYWQPPDGSSADERTAGVEALLPDLSHLHVFSWEHFGERHPLAEGAETWEPVLRLARKQGRWPHRRYAFLEYVEGDDPDRLAADAATLRHWLELEP